MVVIMPYKFREDLLKHKKEYYCRNHAKMLLEHQEYKKKHKLEASISGKIYYLKNKSKKREYGKKRYLKDKIKMNKQSRLWAVNNPEKIKLIKKKVRSSLKGKLMQSKYDKKHRSTLKGRIDNYMATRMWFYLRSTKGGVSWKKLVDYSIKELTEKLFGNPLDEIKYKKYVAGELHIDHKIPLNWLKYSSIADKKFKRAWNLNNLQLLDSKLNVSKGNRYTLDLDKNPVCHEVYLLPAPNEGM